jgi:hypothetical protein
MIEVHPPHKAIHSVKDFLLHMLAITLGLMIALGMQSGVEWRQHRDLAKIARRNIAIEMHENQSELGRSEGAIRREQAELQAVLDYLKRLRKDPHAREPDVDLNINVTNLNRSSWDTASATGALNYMDYSHVQMYEDTYALQDDVDKMQIRRLDAWLQLGAALSAPDPTTVSLIQIDRADQEVRVSQAYANAALSLIHSLDESYTRALHEP